MKTYDDFVKAIEFGNEVLPRVGFFELAKLLGITENLLMEVMFLNKGQFSITADKTITMKKQGKIEFLSVTDALNWFIKNRCDGKVENSVSAYTQKGLGASVTSPISWTKGDFGLAINVTMDGNSDGIGAKETITKNLGAEYAKRAECLGRVGGGGSQTDKWLFGIVLSESEISKREIAGKKVYFYKWTEEEANTDSIPTWIWPQGCSIPVSVSATWEKTEVVETGGKRGRKSKEKETTSEDIPGQQKLEGTDPKPVETAPPASTIKPPATIVPPPPIPTTSESLKQDIRVRAIGDAVLAGTIPPSPPALSGAPPALGGVTTPAPVTQAPLPQVVYTPSPTVVPQQKSEEVIKAEAIQANDLLDSLLSSTKQS